ncbi:MAG: RNA polymerase sigma factor [Acidimicrobiia bacterium]
MTASALERQEATGELMDAPGAGPQTIAVLFAAHHERLVRLAGLLCGDRAVAEDAVAEVFARLLRRPASVAGVDDLTAYLRKAVINELGGMSRRSRARLRREARSRADVGPHGTGELSGDRDRVRTALNRLPEYQRRVIVLRYYEDLTLVGIADVLGIPLGSVKSALSRGLSALEPLLREARDE